MLYTMHWSLNDYSDLLPAQICDVKVGHNKIDKTTMFKLK